MYRFTLTVLVAALLVVSCEKDSLVSEISKDQYITIGFPTVVVEDDMLSFTSVDDFIDALKTVSESSDDEVEGIMHSLNFSSLWMEYYSIMSRIEANPTVSAEQQLLASEAERYFLDDEMLVPFNSSRMFASLLNREGKVLINNELHYFSDKAHVLVKDRSEATLEQVLSEQSAGSLVGVAYTPQYLSPSAIKLINEKSLSNCIQNDFTNLQDEVKNNNRRMNLEYKSNVFVRNLSSTQTEYEYFISSKLRNRKKSGLNWILNFRRCEFRVLTTLQTQRIICPPSGACVTLDFGNSASNVNPFTTTSDGVTADGKVADWEILLNRLFFTDRPGLTPLHIIRAGTIQGRHLDNDNGMITITNHGCL